MMHTTQQRILDAAKNHNLAKMTLREVADVIGMQGTAPQTIKHHLAQLEKKGFLKIDTRKGSMKRSTKVSLQSAASNILAIPIIGTANCGPADVFAEENFHGFLHVSARLVQRAQAFGLFAIKADGSSMNRATIKGKRIEDGDYIVVDSEDKSASNNDIVLVIIDGKATIKRFIDDRANGQIVLKADSSYDYAPMFLHPQDDFSINGKVIGVIKKPKT
ncbi:MAG: S24 family peptidase [Candidatus Moranbacteria bacterium]|nr:S24 family peptidase [Candidatus Moranbacteria bacterium]